MVRKNTVKLSLTPGMPGAPGGGLLGSPALSFASAVCVTALTPPMNRFAQARRDKALTERIRETGALADELAKSGVPAKEQIGTLMHEVVR
jgi:hypothetical protein